MGRRKSLYHKTPITLAVTKRRMTVLGILNNKRDSKIRPTGNGRILDDLYRPQPVAKPINVPTEIPLIRREVKRVTPIHKLTDVQLSLKFWKRIPKYAHVFVTHEIDGEALLMMRRSDVLRLGIPIGPAVRLWAEIEDLIRSRRRVEMPDLN